MPPFYALLGPQNQQTLPSRVELIGAGPSLEQMTGGLYWSLPDEDMIEPFGQRHGICVPTSVFSGLRELKTLDWAGQAML